MIKIIWKGRGTNTKHKICCKRCRKEIKLGETAYRSIINNRRYYYCENCFNLIHYDLGEK